MEGDSFWKTKMFCRKKKIKKNDRRRVVFDDFAIDILPSIYIYIYPRFHFFHAPPIPKNREIKDAVIP